MCPRSNRRRVWWGGIRIGLMGLVALWAGARLMDGALMREDTRVASLSVVPTFGTLPPFALTERSHRVITLADLRGFVWVATFFFSRCGDTCPLQVARMAALGAEFSTAPHFRMVAITVDPAYDTPTVLSAYADHLTLDRTRFLLLTGDRGAIAALAQKGFKLAVGQVESDRGDGSLFVAHSDRLALVDGDGQLRGTYPTRDPEAVAQLRGDLGRLLASDPPPSRTELPAATSLVRTSLKAP